MEQIIVEAAPRETRGKNAARRLRVAGTVPAVLYGGKGGPQALQVNTKQVSAILRSALGTQHHSHGEDRRTASTPRS